MASTVLPNGIIIPEKYSRDWYNDLYHNWQELDNLLAGGGANDGTLTIQKNGTTVGTFSANQATDETVNITVPTKTSDLTNDSNFVPSTDLATVATSGNYNDLSNKPTIPTVNNATLTIQKNGTNVQTFTANQSTNATANITVPTKTSDLTNDSGFITEDTTKIPLAGSNQISGSLIPSTTDTVNLGSSSYQWNNAYIKSLTINGVACGDILTHNVSEFVDVTTAQTIGGEKTFSNLRTYFGRDISCYSNRKYGNNLNPTANTYQYLNFSGNTVSDGPANDWTGGYIEQVVDTNGGSRGRWFVQDTSGNATSVELWASGSDKQFRPQGNNTIDLGTTNRKWKSLNGINPGALSLPGTTGLINIASSITALDGVTINKFTPQVNGWLLINGTGPSNEGFIYVAQGRIEMISANNTAIQRCAVLIPVVAGVEVAVTCKLTTLTWANITPCQGNV